MDEKSQKTLGVVSSFPDRAVSCPICNHEFWGYSEIIFCSCGWTYVKEDDFLKKPVQTLKDSEFLMPYANICEDELEISGKIIDFSRLQIVSKD